MGGLQPANGWHMIGLFFKTTNGGRISFSKSLTSLNDEMRPWPREVSRLLGDSPTEGEHIGPFQFFLFGGRELQNNLKTGWAQPNDVHQRVPNQNINFDSLARVVGLVFHVASRKGRRTAGRACRESRPVRQTWAFGVARSEVKPEDSSNHQDPIHETTNHTIIGQDGSVDLRLEVGNIYIYISWL